MGEAQDLLAHERKMLLGQSQIQLAELGSSEKSAFSPDGTLLLPICLFLIVLAVFGLDYYREWRRERRFRKLGASLNSSS